MFAKILSVVSWFFDLLKDVRLNWFPYMVILLGTAVFGFTVIATTDGVLNAKLISARLEQIGTAWVLFGTLWTALGAHLTGKDSKCLDEMLIKESLDVKEIVRMYKATSNFGSTPF